MKHVLTLEQFMNEGVNDPGILKAFFMAGGPGSGKSYVAGELFGLPKEEIGTVSYATGLKVVSSDNAFEHMLKKAGYDIGQLAKYGEDKEEWEKIMTIRDKARNTTKNIRDNYITGRLGQVIDGTGKDYNKIEKLKKVYEALGYDTYMIFVNTSLEVAKERNNKRARKLPNDIVEDLWYQVQDNMGKFQKLFGKNNLMIVDNSSYDNVDLLKSVEKSIMRKLRRPIQNYIGKNWIESQKNSKV